MNCGNFVHYTLPPKTQEEVDEKSTDSAGIGWVMDCCSKKLVGLLAIEGAISLLGLLVRAGLRNQRHSGHSNGRSIVINWNGSPPISGHQNQG